MLGIQLLGQFSVMVDGATIVLPSRPAQSLLARLALSPGIAHRREKLAGDLWPDANETNARSNLRHALWRIRDALSPSAEILRADHIAISFERHNAVSVDAIDVLRTSQNAMATLDDLIHAASLYRGEMLPGFYDEWVGFERVRLAAAFDSIMSRLLNRLLSLHRWVEAADWASHWFDYGESIEAACRAQMQAHFELGNLDAVRADYNRCKRRLAREVGVALSQETSALYESVTRPHPRANPRTHDAGKRPVLKGPNTRRADRHAAARRHDQTTGLLSDRHWEMQGLLRYDPIPFPLMQ